MAISSLSLSGDEQQTDELTTQLEILFLKIRHNEHAIKEQSTDPPNSGYFRKEYADVLSQKEAER